MIVCLCTGVNSAEFTEALKNCDGDWQRASFETGAGTCCGGCRHYLAQMAEREETKPQEAIPVLVVSEENDHA